MDYKFGKNLARELLQYFRRLWPYISAFAAVSVLTCVVVMYDSNPVEATGTVTAIGFFAMAAVAFVVCVFFYAYKFFYKSLTEQKPENPKHLHRYIWVRVVAFAIVIIITTLLLLAGVSSFAFNYVRNMFSATVSNWYYLPEFVLFFAIFTISAYLIPIGCIVISRFDNKRKLTIIGGVFTSMMTLLAVVLEVVALIHSPSTDMPFVWGMLAILFVLFILVCIRMYLLTYRTLKTVLHNQQSDSDEEAI